MASKRGMKLGEDISQPTRACLRLLSALAVRTAVDTYSEWTRESWNRAYVSWDWLLGVE